ncbi:inositol monophosphatase family protein [Candidatus Liberibacter americanus]|uniref:Inositol-1-monophosphatase n=1 Tax=Candidatus Liberibacter americanus str. Sao Paulo TaxID=1261131 RepID=U6B4I9_9HYPH|nr:inositol monophosphatase family protein [Candidatus Liberibacter americanus]AHA27810.1 Inositol-1-monophosphatase [Candidatus Liberibacter americanus str. Sao Paulo]EMS36194.1 Inositol-1-monophosphatase [Candidatus Liberibacter americanus PW_SP]
MPRSALLNVMVEAALKAGRSLLRDFGDVQNLQISLKGPADFVTQADLKSQEIIYQQLSHARPNYGFCGEEGEYIRGKDSNVRWIVDPLDGTTNFLHAIPHFCVSIALERNNEIVASVIFSPITDELYTAERGSGAFLNDRRIRVASRRMLSKSVICCGIPHLGFDKKDDFIVILRRIMDRVAGVRRFGAAALDLAYIAAGRFDGFWEVGLSPWDMAAGIMLIREAGGLATDFSGGNMMFETKSIVAGNSYIHKEILRIVGN